MRERAAGAGVGGVAPLFIVKSVPAALAFYRDRLGFEVTFQGLPRSNHDASLLLIQTSFGWVSGSQAFMGRVPVQPSRSTERGPQNEQIFDNGALSSKEMSPYF